MNLLIVNDAIYEAEDMKEHIDWPSYGVVSVMTAYCSEDAKEVIRSSSVDILLCDIEMPGENGLFLIRWIRENQYDIDCILLTCHADFSYAKEAVSLNCHEYVLLPALYREIGESVQKAIIRRKARLKEKKLQEYGRNWLDAKNSQVYEASGRKTKEIVNDCIRYVQENMDQENLSVSMIADHFYINATHLNRLFKKEKGINLSQWIIRERMALAAHLLEETDVSAIIIAAQCGYSNYPYFSTTFKKYYQYTPSGYREVHQKCVKSE